MPFYQTAVAELLFCNDRDQRTVAFGKRRTDGTDIFDFTPADYRIYSGQRGQSVSRHESVERIFSGSTGNADQ